MAPPVDDDALNVAAPTDSSSASCSPLVFPPRVRPSCSPLVFAQGRMTRRHVSATLGGVSEPPREPEPLPKPEPLPGKPEPPLPLQPPPTRPVPPAPPTRLPSR